jgi:hypothetical protein
LNHLLTEAAVDWEGLSGEIARQADALLGGETSALMRIPSQRDHRFQTNVTAHSDGT